MRDEDRVAMAMFSFLVALVGVALPPDPYQDLVAMAIFSFLVALASWGLWCLRSALVTKLASSHRDRRVLYLTPLACVLVLPVGLMGKDVVNPQRWHEPVLNCLCFGLWLPAVAVWALPWLGLSGRDDVAERRNRPAGWAIAGAALALILAYGGAAGGIVEARTAKIAVPAGILSMIAVLILWGILEKLARLSEAITVERDAGAACRLTAFLPALAVLVGQVLPTLLTASEAVQSLAVLGGPATLLLAAVLIERRRNCSQEWYVDPRKLLLAGVLTECRKRPRGRPGGRPSVADVLIALFYLSSAGLWTYLAR